MSANQVPILNSEDSTIPRHVEVPPYDTPEFRAVFQGRVRFREDQLGRKLTNSELLATLDALRQIAGEPTLFPEENYLDTATIARELEPYEQLKDAFKNAGSNLSGSADSTANFLGNFNNPTINLVSIAVIVVGFIWLSR